MGEGEEEDVRVADLVTNHIYEILQLHFVFLRRISPLSLHCFLSLQLLESEYRLISW